MKKSRILVSAAVAAGLGLTGAASASASGTSAPDRPAPVQQAKAAPVAKPAPGGKHGGPTLVCVIHKAPGGKAGHQGTGAPTVFGFGVATGKAQLQRTQAPQGKSSKTTIKIVNGKVYINGKLAPKGKIDTKCPELPPLPPLKGGKPGKVVTGGESGLVQVPDASGHAGLTTAGTAPSSRA
jgi:hypothetical protein